MIDVSYRYKQGVWMMDEVTSEVHEVVPEPVEPPPPPPPVHDVYVDHDLKDAVEEKIAPKVHHKGKK